MDMPITVPRASVTESVDDLKARDMVLCRFPEVDMVVGKAGRAETPTDPAPDGHDRDHGQLPPPRIVAAPQAGDRRCRAPGPRRLRRPGRTRSDPGSGNGGRARRRLIEQSVAAALAHSSTQPAANMRTTAIRKCCANTGGISPTSMNPSEPEEARVVAPWRDHVANGRRRADRAGRADLHAAGDGAAPRPRDHHRPDGGGLQRGVCQGPRGRHGSRDPTTSSRPRGRSSPRRRPPSRPRAR